MKYSRLIAWAASQVWAIDPVKGRAILEFLSFSAAGGKYDDEERAAKIGQRTDSRIARSPGSVAVIPMMGIMSQRVDMLTAISEGGVSTEAVGRQITAAAENDDIKAIIMHIASPGGGVYGIEELSQRINAAKERKPVIAQVDSYAASAAYWAASQASEIVVAPGGDVGSIGVYTVHEDISAMLEAAGVKETMIYAGKYKVEGNPFAPLDDDAKAHMQARVDEAYKAFVSYVASGRGKDVEYVMENFGQGRMVGADKAVKAGMADRIATLDETIARFTGSKPKRDMNAMKAKRLALEEKI